MGWTSPWRLDVGSHTDVGKVRSHNEDAFMLSRDLSLFAVADGMGGHNAGERASRLAVEALLDFCRCAREENLEACGETLQEGTVWANRLVFEDAGRDPARKGMGTTLTALMLSGEQYSIGHVGDSRAWRIRDGSVEQLTQDHSFVAEQVRVGTLTEEQAAVHPLRNVLTRSLGIQEELEVDLYRGEVVPGDVFVLGSDGMAGVLDAERIRTVVDESEDADSACRRLVDLACDEDGRDNATTVIVACYAST